MPKVTPSNPKGSSKGSPYSIKLRPRAPRKTAAKGWNRRNLRGFRFLDLPPEIRLQIYGYFAVVDKIVLPKDPETYVEELFELGKRMVGVCDVKETRRSLQMVCRQISKEWAPIFFSTTTIIVSPARSPDDESMLPEEGLGDFQRTTEEFKDIFIKTTAERKLKHITKLKYIDFLDKDLTSFRTGQGVASLLGSLQEHLPRLPSLSKVTYLAVFDRDLDNLLRLEDENAATDDTAFDFLDSEGQIRTLEQQALGETATGVLNGWKSHRKMVYWVGFQGERLNCEYMKLIFRREQLPSPGPKEGGVQQT